MLDSVLHYVPLYSRVTQTVPNQPLKFVNDATSIDLPTLIDKYCPEFSNGASALFHPLLFNGHLQTMYSAFQRFENIDLVHYKRLVINYQDGGEGTADFVVPPDTPVSDYTPPNQSKKLFPRYSYFTPEEIEKLPSTDGKPLLIVLHGLTGSSDESYVRSLVNKITSDYGFEACVLNSRGCCQSTITTPRLYSGLWTDDIREFVHKLRDMYPKRKFYMVGISLGASMATNYLGQERDSSEIECAAVLGNPWDMAYSSYFLKRSFTGNSFYSPAMAKNCVRLVNNNIDQLKKDPYLCKLLEEKLDKVTTVEEFDNWFTSKMFGFNNSFEYYRHGSSSNRLLHVRTPLLAINATDDPIVGSEALPYREIQDNPYTLLLETSKGGHIGWFSYNGTRWYLEPLCKFLSSFHNKIVMEGLKPDFSSVKLPHENKFVNDRLISDLEIDF